MKEKIIFLFLALFSTIAILGFIFKLIFWLGSRSAKKVGLIKSYFVFFSIHDIHNATSKSSKNFRKYSNIINILFWVSIFGLAIVFVFNTSNVNGLIPTKQEKREYK
jgi:F0F1-type ATP synthase membrane subunit c/vacuolar-type H+-ATPase subunit K